MILKYPELNGGTVQGLNDAGVENFLGAIDVYLSRECGQNTGDAPRLGIHTVRLEFDRLSIPATDIPAFGELRGVLQACLDKWGSKDKEREFFQNAITLAARDELSVLRISDFGTTGLTGADTDELGRWFALVKSQGVSNKGDTAGGSFGIGKSSPFAASRFRTVFYGTRTEGGDVAFQGVSRLVSHKNSEGRLTQGTGFIGNYDVAGADGGEPLFSAIRDEPKIPPIFKRSEPGTDIWIIGYRSGAEWSDDLIRSILSNFWPAIHRGQIEFRVGTKLITKDNLADLIAQHAGQEEFDAHHFFKAALNQPITKTLRHTGTCELYLTASSPDLPRKILMARKTGMRIYDYQPKACRVPFSGMLICTDAEGNKLLRKLEPPKHNVWDPKRTDDDSGKKALEEIKLWIREEVKKLNPLFSGNSFNENEVAKYIPDQSEDPNDLPQQEVGPSHEEDLEPKPESKELTPDVVKAKPIIPIPGTQKGGGRKPPETPGGGDGGGGGGGGDGDGEKPGIESGDQQEDDLPEIMVRSYRAGTGEEYDLVLRCDKDFKGKLSVQAVGEGLQDPVTLLSADLKDGSGQKLKVTNNAIEGLQLTASTPLRIAVKLDAIERRSLTALPTK
jgi:hypothetical protein